MSSIMDVSTKQKFQQQMSEGNLYVPGRSQAESTSLAKHAFSVPPPARKAPRPIRGRGEAAQAGPGDNSMADFKIGHWEDPLRLDEVKAITNSVLESISHRRQKWIRSGIFRPRVAEFHKRRQGKGPYKKLCPVCHYYETEDFHCSCLVMKEGTMACFAEPCIHHHFDGTGVPKNKDGVDKDVEDKTIAVAEQLATLSLEQEGASSSGTTE